MGQFLSLHWGDLASVLGLLAALVGFGVTIYKATKAATASEAARRAANEVRQKLFEFDTVSHLTEAISVMSEVKRLQRAGAWSVLPDRYSTLRRLLILVLGADAGLDENGLSYIATTVKHLDAMEYRIEKSIHTSIQPPSVTNLNQKMSEYIDRLTELLAQHRTTVGDHQNG